MGSSHSDAVHPPILSASPTHRPSLLSLGYTLPLSLDSRSTSDTLSDITHPFLPPSITAYFSIRGGLEGDADKVLSWKKKDEESIFRNVLVYGLE